MSLKKSGSNPPRQINKEFYFKEIDIFVESVEGLRFPMVEQAPEVKMIMEELKEMREWRMKMTEYIKTREQPAAAAVQVPAEVDEDMEDDQTNDSMELSG